MYGLEFYAGCRQASQVATKGLWSLSWYCSLVCILSYCLFAETKSHFRQEHKLLGVLQTMENDTTHLSRVAVPTEKPVADPEVRAYTHGTAHCTNVTLKAEGRGLGAAVNSGWWGRP